MAEIISGSVVSAAEVERFKLERAAERGFLSKLQVLVKDFESQVSPKNSVLRSMLRFLKASF